MTEEKKDKKNQILKTLIVHPLFLNFVGPQDGIKQTSDTYNNTNFKVVGALRSTNYNEDVNNNILVNVNYSCKSVNVNTIEAIKSYLNTVNNEELTNKRLFIPPYSKLTVMPIKNKDINDLANTNNVIAYPGKNENNELLNSIMSNGDFLPKEKHLLGLPQVRFFIEVNFNEIAQKSYNEMCEPDSLILKPDFKNTVVNNLYVAKTTFIIKKTLGKKNINGKDLNVYDVNVTFKKGGEIDFPATLYTTYTINDHLFHRNIESGSLKLFLSQPRHYSYDKDENTEGKRYGDLLSKINKHFPNFKYNSNTIRYMNHVSIDLFSDDINDINTDEINKKKVVNPYSIHKKMEYDSTKDINLMNKSNVENNTTQDNNTQNNIENNIKNNNTTDNNTSLMSDEVPF